MPKTIPELGGSPRYHEVIRNLHFAVRLLTRGAAIELTEHHNLSQPEADVRVLQALACELDVLADLPTMLIGLLLGAIRASVENEHADALALTEGDTLIGEEADSHIANPI